MSEWTATSTTRVWLLSCVLPHALLSIVVGLAHHNERFGLGLGRIFGRLLILAGPTLLIGDQNVYYAVATLIFLGASFLAWHFGRSFSPWSVAFALIAVTVWFGTPLSVLVFYLD
jgi:hypothetical protein